MHETKGGGRVRGTLRLAALAVLAAPGSAQALFPLPGEHPGGWRGWGFMDETGRIVARHEHRRYEERRLGNKPISLHAPPQYEDQSTSFYSESEMAHYFLDRSGSRMPISPGVRIMEVKTQYCGGFAAVECKDSRGGATRQGFVLIDRSGTPRIPEARIGELQLAEPAVMGFTEDRLLLRFPLGDGYRYGFFRESEVDGAWRPLTKETFQDAAPFRRGFAKVAVLDERSLKRWGLLHADGDLLLPPRFDEVEPFTPSVRDPADLLPAPCRDGLLWGYYGVNGEPRFLAADGRHVRFNRATVFSPEGIAFVKTGLSWSAIDASGADLPWDLRGVEEAHAFTDGFALMKLANGAGYRFLDGEGRVAWPRQDDDVSGVKKVFPFRDGLACVLVGDDGEFEYMDASFQVLNLLPE